MHLDPLISDLTIILVTAGLTTLLFKRLRQPLVLGYVLAGFLASPHMPYTPSVETVSSIQTWADIGVLFLLFALGLDFSFKKIMKMGSTPIIAACTIIFCMMLLGIGVGHLFGWASMDCIFLGGILAMSSTTIIYKAFDDMGLRQQRFAGLVLSVLILEDILAVVMMVMLSTLAHGSDIGGGQLLASITRLGFFLILWFVAGIFLVPIFLKRVKSFLTDETMLVVAIALCLGMVWVATSAGFSSAFGAFMMGSILAETLDAERIERLVSPLKDLFGAIFFVSVGMLVDPHVLIEYAVPIIVLVLTILIGQAIFGTFGFVLSGQSLRTSMQCGFSMAQIGEFGFILASLGLTLHVTSSFLYPIVVAVSVVTTFLTPYMIRFSIPAYNRLKVALPQRWDGFVAGRAVGHVVGHTSHWHRLLREMLFLTIVYSVLCIAIIVLSLSFLLPFTRGILPHWWANGVTGVVCILALSPFLRAFVMRKNHSVDFRFLWDASIYNRPALLFTILVRMVLAVSYVFYVVRYLVPFADPLLVGGALILVMLMISSRALKKHSIVLERTFLANLNQRELYKEMQRLQDTPQYTGRLNSHDLHLSILRLPEDSLWAGQTLRQLNLGHLYGVHVTSIQRGERRINIPGPDTRLYPLDKLQVVGTDLQMQTFSEALAETVSQTIDEEATAMDLRQMVVTAESPLAGLPVFESGIRQHYRCVLVGIERPDGMLEVPEANRIIQPKDILWLVGEDADLQYISKDKR